MQLTRPLGISVRNALTPQSHEHERVWPVWCAEDEGIYMPCPECDALAPLAHVELGNDQWKPIPFEVDFIPWATLVFWCSHCGVTMSKTWQDKKRDWDALGV